MSIEHWPRWADMPEFHVLPDDWKLAYLTDIAEVIAGQSPPSETYNSRGIGLPFLQGCAEFGEEFPVTQKSCFAPSKKAPPRSTLISVRAPVGALNRADQEYAIGRGLAALVANQLDPDYLFYGLHRWRRSFQRIGQGTTFEAITVRQINQVIVALPQDENEQRRIAKTLKLADDAIDKVRAELDAAQELRRSLMKTLFSQRIAKHRAGWQETKLGKIPSNWRVVRIKDILIEKPTNGYSPQSNPEPPGTKTLNVACIRHGECDVNKATYVDIENSVIESLQVHSGDFFVLRGNGNRDFIGIGGVVRDEMSEPMIYSDLLFRLKFKESEVVPLFMPYFWQTQTFLNRLQAKAKSGSGLWKIGKRDIDNELVALPSKAEQLEIVTLVESATLTCNKIRSKVESLQDVKRSLLQNLLTGKIRIPPTIEIN